MLLSYRLVMLLCIGALMSNPVLLKLTKPTGGLTKPTGGLRRIWFQMSTTFLLCFDEDDLPCVQLGRTHKNKQLLNKQKVK